MDDKNTNILILAGGRGARIYDAMGQTPKPLIPIGGKPILWHVMKMYALQGFHRFTIALGFEADRVRGEMERHIESGWDPLFVDTGKDTASGGRIKMLAPMFKETFLLSFTDGLTDLNFHHLLATHRAQKTWATVAAVRPPLKFGELAMEGGRVVGFSEKKSLTPRWINGGIFALEPQAFQCFDDATQQMEHKPMQNLVAQHQLSAHRHEGFWQCMDDVNELYFLEELWRGGAPWLRGTGKA